MRIEMVLIIIGMGIVTYIPRWMPLFFLARRRLAPWLRDWLDFIPAAILSALILPSILTTGEPRHIEWGRPDLWAAIPTFLFALKTKSLGGTVVIGMFAYWLASQVLR
jgi:branched-subunit amino acid transport protein